MDDKRRLQIAKLMKNYGERVQKSVFECRLDDRRFLKLKLEIEKIIDWEEDSVRFYTLCAGCVKNINISGIGFVREEDDIVVV